MVVMVVMVVRVVVMPAFAVACKSQLWPEVPTPPFGACRVELRVCGSLALLPIDKVGTR